MSMRDLIPWGRQNETAPYRAQEMSPIFSLRREMDRLFDDLFRTPSLGFAGSMTSWPTLEVSDGEREVKITAEVPGMSEQEIELLVRDGVLTIRGEKKSESGDKERGYSERWYGRFERRIALPSGIDEEGAKASFRDGVLTVTLPKSGDSEGVRRIPINAATRH
jgi:HSP20 family protein